MTCNTNYCEWCYQDLKDISPVKKPYGKFCCEDCLNKYLWSMTTRGV